MSIFSGFHLDHAGIVHAHVHGPFRIWAISADKPLSFQGSQKSNQPFSVRCGGGCCFHFHNNSIRLLSAMRPKPFEAIGTCELNF